MEMEMKKAIRISDGIHTGTIINLIYDTEPYNYARVIIKVDSSETEINYSCPYDTTKLTEGSKFMRLLQVFGIQFEEGKKISPENALVNQRVQFQIVNRPSKKNPTKVYSEIVEDSVKPLP